MPRETGFFRLVADCDMLILHIDHWFDGDTVCMRLYYHEDVVGDRGVTDFGVVRACITAENYAAEMQKIVDARGK